MVCGLCKGMREVFLRKKKFPKGKYISCPQCKVGKKYHLRLKNEQGSGYLTKDGEIISSLVLDVRNDVEMFDFEAAEEKAKEWQDKGWTFCVDQNY